MVERRVEDLRESLEALSDPAGVLATLLQHSATALALYNPAGFCVRVNPAYRELFGSEPAAGCELSEDEVLGRSGVLFWVRRAFGGESVTTPTFWYQHPEPPSPASRRRVALSARAFPLLDQAGRIEFVAVTFRDETDSMLLAERHRSEVEVPRRLLDEIERADLERRTNEEQFRAVFEQCADGVMLTDDSGRVLDINPSGCRIFGRRVQDIVGSRYWEHIGEVAESRPLGQRLVEEGQICAEVRVWRADGRLRDLELRAVANFLPHRHLTTFLDVTDRNEALRALRDLNQNLEGCVADRTAQLEAANRDLEAFAYSVSHDLRAPLRAINGYAKILLDDRLDDYDEARRTALLRIESSARRMDGLIDGLLALSRLGRCQAEIRPVETRAILEEALEEVGIAPGSPAVEIAVGDLPACEADPVLLRQVFVNLLGNAAKFSRGRSPARIEVRCENRDGRQVWCVRDNGIGFDMGEAAQIFDVFRRLPTVDAYEGTGVGLAIVERIVQRHGGRVWAEAQPGSGAAFYFTL